MSIEKVRNYFRQFGLESRIQEFDVSSETVELAALAVGCEPGRIAKTMSFLVGGQPVLISMAGDARIANPKFKAAFHTKAAMIPFDQVGQYIGHEAGGVCPFAVQEGVRVYLDVSLKRFHTVYPAAGSGNSAIPLTIPELERYSHADGWVDVCKDWQTP
ncbi:MAG TPA: YbaK/EbsC family protein [Candidatus Faecousia intestinigallinarum]|nr:YbaK/EbsC family protein [Candidatus Faecousia intestinigallinarum]